MNTYSNPLTITHRFGQQDIGNGTDLQNISGPHGCRGRIRFLGLEKITEAFTATTTAAKIEIGDGTDVDKYASWTLATQAIDAVDDAVRGTEIFNNQEIAADSTVRVTMTAPTGGTPAGIADVVVVIDWYI